jgi:hypothetical protein
MNELLQGFTQYGALGLIAGISVYQVIFLQGKIITLVENNTKAMSELKVVIDGCQKIHDRS